VIAINEATTQEAKREQLAMYAASREANWEMKFLKEVLNVQA
jgi:type IV secretion system protein TrbE